MYYNEAIKIIKPEYQGTVGFDEFLLFADITLITD